MPIELKIPAVGESITEVQISRWLKAEGDAVQKDEPVAVIDSEKTTFELPAPQGGTLTKILRQAGDTVKVGEAVAQIEAGGATASPPSPKKLQAEETPAPAQREPSPPPAKEARGTGAKKKETAAPVVKEEPDTAELSEEENAPAKAAASEKAAPRVEEKPEPTPIDSATLSPAPGRPSAKAAAERDEEVVPMTMLRRTIARRLVEAQQAMAMLTTFNEVDMDAVQKVRRQRGEEFRNRYGVKLGLMSFFVKAAIDALKQFPQLNAEVRGTDIIYRNYFDIGVAIASERGLVVPILRQAERLSFAEVEMAIADLAQRARDGGLNPEELEGGTFTITNGGVFGSLLSTPIINPPQSGILGLHAIEDRPVAREGAVVIRPMMFVALTYDHRIVDGREAVLFLRRIKDTIEDPVRMLVEI